MIWPETWSRPIRLDLDVQQGSWVVLETLPFNKVEVVAQLWDDGMLTTYRPLVPWFVIEALFQKAAPPVLRRATRKPYIQILSCSAPPPQTVTSNSGFHF